MRPVVLLSISAEKTEEAIILWRRFFNGKKREEFADVAKTNEYLEKVYQRLEARTSGNGWSMRREKRQRKIIIPR